MLSTFFSMSSNPSEAKKRIALYSQCNGLRNNFPAAEK